MCIRGCGPITSMFAMFLCVLCKKVLYIIYSRLLISLCLYGMYTQQGCKYRLVYSIDIIRIMKVAMMPVCIRGSL